jgi:hypothetical protein
MSWIDCRRHGHVEQLTVLLVTALLGIDRGWQLFMTVIGRLGLQTALLGVDGGVSGS